MDVEARKKRHGPKEPVDQRTKVHIFDFDNTLFRSPGPLPGQKPKDWFPGSLGHESGVPQEPNDHWYVDEMVNRFKEAQKDPRSFIAISTGRWPMFHERVRELLAHKGLHPDMMLMKDPEEFPVGQTATFKQHAVDQILGETPGAKQVFMYDDNKHHLSAMEEQAEKHDVKVHAKGLSPEEQEKSRGGHYSFQEFLYQFYDGGKRMVKNTNQDTKDQFPQVQADTLFNEDPTFRAKLLKQFQTWRTAGAIRRKKMQARVASAWLNKKKTEAA
jgi:hypothetical protein